MASRLVQQPGEASRAPLRPRDIDVLVGRALRARRQALGMPLTGLAARVGITYQQIQRYENGQSRIPAGRLYALAQALGVAPGELFAGLAAPENAAPGTVDPPAGATGTTDWRPLLLVRAYGAIRSPPLRQALLDVARRLMEADAAARRGRASGKKGS